jgi:hypothetical protein
MSNTTGNDVSNQVSGTWKCMGSQYAGGGGKVCLIFVRTA